MENVGNVGNEKDKPKIFLINPQFPISHLLAYKINFIKLY